jgi:hypothetical protein
MGRLSIFGALALVSACATAEPLGGTVEEQRDAAPQTFPDAAPPDAGPAAVTLSQSTSMDIIADNSVACSLNSIHAENRYYRVFDLAGEGITTDLEISQVTVGIEVATAGSGGMQPIQVLLHTLPDGETFVRANLDLINSVTVQVPDQSLSLLPVEIAATAPGGSKLVVEVLTPDGEPAGHSLFIGSNGGGQSAPSYIAADSGNCNFPEPVDTATASPNAMHIVLTVDGVY